MDAALACALELPARRRRTLAYRRRVRGIGNGEVSSGLWLYNGNHDSYDNAIVHIIGIDPNDPQSLKNYLGDREVDSLKGGTGTFDHIAFTATDVRSMITHLKNGKVPFRERTVPDLNLQQVFLDDPSGVVIELNYPADEKAAA